MKVYVRPNATVGQEWGSMQANQYVGGGEWGNYPSVSVVFVFHKPHTHPLCARMLQLCSMESNYKIILQYNFKKESFLVGPTSKWLQWCPKNYICRVNNLYFICVLGLYWGHSLKLQCGFPKSYERAGSGTGRLMSIRGNILYRISYIHQTTGIIWSELEWFWW